MSAARLSAWPPGGAQIRIMVNPEEIIKRKFEIRPLAVQCLIQSKTKEEYSRRCLYELPLTAVKRLGG